MFPEISSTDDSVVIFSSEVKSNIFTSLKQRGDLKAISYSGAFGDKVVLSDPEQLNKKKYLSICLKAKITKRSFLC